MITSLFLKNFLGIGNDGVLFIFKAGITIIIGENGAGKSTLLDGLNYGLEGKAYSNKTKEQLINWHNKGGTIIEVTSMKGENEYKLKRTIKPDKVEFLENGVLKDHGGVKDFNAMIKRVFDYDPTIFEQTVFMSKKFYKPFLDSTPDEKRKFLRKVFDLQKYELMEARIKDDISLEANDISKLESQILISSQNLSFIEKQQNDLIVENETKIKTANSDIVKLTSELNILKASIQAVKDVTELLAAIAEYKKIISTNELKIQSVDSEISAYNLAINQKKTLESTLELTKSNLQASSEKLIQGKNNLLAMKEIKQESIDIFEKELLKYKDGFQKLNIEYSKLETQYTTLQQNINNPAIPVQSKLLEYTELYSKYQNAEKEKIVCESQKSTIISRMKYNEKSDSCDNCGTELTQELKKKTIDRCEFEIQTLDSTIKAHTDSSYLYANNIRELKQSILNELKLQIDNMKIDVEARKKKIESGTEMLSTMRKQLESYNNLKSSLAVIQTEHDSILKAIASAEKQCEEHLVPVIPDSTVKQTLSAQNEVLAKQILAIEADIEVQKGISTRNTEIQTKCDDKLIEIKTSENTIKLCEQAVLKIKQSMEISSLRASIDANTVLLNEHKFKHSCYNKMLPHYGDAGIKNFIIGRYIPFLNQLCDKYCEILGSKFRVKFDTNGLNVDITYRGKSVKYGQLSMGQEQRINLVVLFAFIDFIRSKTTKAFPMIFFDEVLNSSLDKNGIETLITLLNQMKEKIPNIIIITHDIETTGFADNIIKVRQEGEFSKYEFE